MQTGELNVDFNVARSERKRAEQDAQLLANRISLLKAEMAKASKKIVEVQEKTARIAQTQQYHDARFNEKYQISLAQQAEVEKNAKLVEVQKMRVARSTQRNISRVLTAKQGDVDEVRAARILHEQEIAERREAERAQAERMRLAVQAQREEARRKREAEAEVRAARAREVQQQKVAAELAAREKKIAEVRRLEREELALIEALQRTQMQQQVAYDTLEHSLTASKAAFIEASGALSSARSSRVNLHGSASARALSISPTSAPQSARGRVALINGRPVISPQSFLSP